MYKCLYTYFLVFLWTQVSFRVDTRVNGRTGDHTVVTAVGTSPVDHYTDRPAYLQIADQLRDRLDTGDLRPGDKLPSESQLMGEFLSSRSTVRHALKQLARDGLVESTQGIGVFVRARSGTKRLVARDPAALLKRPSNAPDQGLLAADATRQDFHYAVQVRRAEVPASESVARLLAVEPGTLVFARKRVVWLQPPASKHHVPAKLANSYLPLDIAVGKVRDEHTGRGGTYARIEDNGHQLTHFHESLFVRMPDARERRLLRLTGGVPVFDQTRVAYAGDRPVECFLAVMSGEMYELEYRIRA